MVLIGIKHAATVPDQYDVQFWFFFFDCWSFLSYLSECLIEFVSVLYLM